MRIERVAVGGDPVAAAAAVRALAPAPASVSDVVARDRRRRPRRRRPRAARARRALRHGRRSPAAARICASRAEDLDAGLLDDDVRAGPRGGDHERRARRRRRRRRGRRRRRCPRATASCCARCPCAAPRSTCPGGRAPYPSTVVMGVVTARAAGVEEVAVLTPPPIDPVIRGTCDLCGVHEVYAMGGAHGIAALAYGTETIERADVIAGPGSLIVQEAKRQVSDSVGIDGFYGPSDVLVFADASADPELIALDLLAQGEHGPGAPVVARLRLVAAAARRARRARAPRRRSRALRARRVRPRPRRVAARGAALLRGVRARAPRARRPVRGAPRAARALRRAASSSAPPARRRSATTSRVRTTACRPAARRATRPACRRGRFAAG